MTAATHTFSFPFIPQPLCLLHPLLLDPELLRQHLPQLLPLEHIPVHHIKRLVLLVRVHRR
ncbi:unnamed protein product, partial [Linum tenue]